MRRLWAPSIVIGLLALSGCNLFVPVKKTGCQIAGDCKTGEVCLNHTCKSLDAARCGSEAVCTESSTCSSGACENGCCLKACAVQSECGFPLECSDGACRPQAQSGCAGDGDCTSTSAPHCDLVSGACVVCIANADCPPDGTCEDHSCNYPVKVGCDVDVDCVDPLLPRCQTATRACVSCLQDGDCHSSDGGMMICNKTINACEQVRTTCATDSDCNNKPLTPHCRVGDGVCVECQISAQCTEGKICFAANTCGYVGNCGTDLDCETAPGKPYCDATVHKCVECTDSTACGPGFGCAPTHTCEESTGCRTNAQCTAANKHVCHVPSGICYGCLTNTDCGAEGTCTNNSCVYPPPPVCNRDADCGAGKVCTAAVYPHDSTQAGNLCVPKEPGATYGPGHVCTTDSQCKSGLCLVAGLLGYCQGGCTADSDCQSADGTAGAGACTKINLYWTSSADMMDHVTQVSSCVIQCQAELDCYPYGTCLLAPSITNDHWVTRCDPNPRSFTTWGGAECASQADCGTGSCIKRNGAAKGICSGMCGGANGGVASCAPTTSLFSNDIPTCPPSGVKLPLPGGSLQTANVCWGPPCAGPNDSANCPAADLLGLTHWKCLSDQLGNGTSAYFCHPP